MSESPDHGQSGSWTCDRCGMTNPSSPRRVCCYCVPDLTRKQRRKAKRLTYAYKRCECGALYAIDGAQRAWDCSDILLGVAAAKGAPGSIRHSDTMPFIFWKVKEAPRDWALENRRKAPVREDARHIYGEFMDCGDGIR